MKSFGCLTLKDKLRKGSEVLSQGPRCKSQPGKGNKLRTQHEDGETPETSNF